MKHKGIVLKGIFSILAVLLLFGAADAGSTIYQNNVKTAQHVFAPGAKVAIIPPAGSRVSQKIVGFDLASGGGTIAFSERAGAYADHIGGYTKEYFGSRGYTLQDTSNVVLNGQQARLFKLLHTEEQEGKEFGVWMLLLGDSKRLITVEGRYPKENTSLGNTIKRALLSSFLQTAQPENASGGFSVSTQGTEFRFAEDVAGVRYYTTDGQPVPNPIKRAVFSIGKRNANVEDKEKRLAYSMELLTAGLENKSFSIQSQNPITLAGLQGYEIMCRIDGVRLNSGKGFSKARVVKGGIYQVTLFDASGTVYVMQGMAVREAMQYMSQFKSIAASFKLSK